MAMDIDVTTANSKNRSSKATQQGKSNTTNFKSQATLQAERNQLFAQYDHMMAQRNTAIGQSGGR